MSTDLTFDDNDGSPLVPTNPALARSRLAELQADKSVVEALLNPLHPLHTHRILERKALEVVISRGANK